MPVKAEPDVWRLVRKVNSVEAYETYLTRFPNGPHFAEAYRSKHTINGQFFPPPPVPPAPPAPPAPILPCTQLIIDHALEKIVSEEVRALEAAQRGNRTTDYQAFIDQFPNGVCRERVAKTLAGREARKRRFKPIMGLGPLAAQRTNPQIFFEEDYPLEAIDKREQGEVVVEWQVTEDGVPENCTVTRSSGSVALDQETCRIIGVRLRYDPARDTYGTPIRTKDHLTIKWGIPADFDSAEAAKQIGESPSEQ